MFESVYFAGKAWLLPAALWLAAGLATVWWAYRGSPLDRNIHGACIGLKCLGLLLLLLCLLDPMTSQERAKPGANRLAILADTSEGLNLTGAGESQPRAQVLQQQLTPQSDNWQTQLANDFDLKRYTFDSQLRNVVSFDELKFTGQASRLGEALRTVARRYQGQPLAGIVIFTDGVATDLEDNLALFDGLPPIYPVVIGKAAPERDLALHTVTPTQTAFEDAPVSIIAQVVARGFSGEEITAQLKLLDSTGKPAATIQSLTREADEDTANLTFRFKIRPAARGILFYRLSIHADETIQEATLANNSRTVVIDRGGGPYRVLYVAGRPNWEYKFLQRAVQEDEQVDLVGLIRVARKEAKFEFKGRKGENTNPLARGSGQDVGEFDQPVLVRLNTSDAEELKTGFPSEPEELFNYSAIIIDDLESTFFTPAQHALLHRFVNERGGGLLMLGGQESFRQGEYARTPVGRLLPVYLDSPDEVAPLNDLKLSLTRDGWLQPWVRLRDNEAADRIRLEEMTEFVSLNRVRGKKPGANVLATVSTGNLPSEPALVTHTFGRGRVASVLLGDLWRWGLKGETEREDLDKTWRQLIRWLVADVPAPFDLATLQGTGIPDREITLQAHDEAFLPLDNAQVKLTVTSLNTHPPVPLPAEADPNQAGRYQAQYLPRQNGGYLVEAEVHDETGQLLGRQQAGWATDHAAAEYRSLAPDTALLKEIAQRSGGRVIQLDELDRFTQELPAQRAPVTEIRHVPLWHQGPIFLLALLCFISEWFLRRRKGLP